MTLWLIFELLWLESCSEPAFFLFKSSIHTEGFSIVSLKSESSRRGGLCMGRHHADEDLRLPDDSARYAMCSWPTYNSMTNANPQTRSTNRRTHRHTLAAVLRQQCSWKSQSGFSCWHTKVTSPLLALPTLFSPLYAFLPIFLLPWNKHLWENENTFLPMQKMKTLFYRCNLTNTICPPSPHFTALFCFAPPHPPLTLCPTFGHPIISIHQTIISPPASRHSGVMSDKLRSSTYAHTPNCFSSHPPR